MSKITLHQKNQSKIIETADIHNLLQIIRENGFDLFAPCGGEGSCGKCKVLIKDEGSVTACTYIVKEDVEVFLPGQKESKILTTQYHYIIDLPLDPGSTVKNISAPLGLAIDLGTTTMVFYFTDLATGGIIRTTGMMNPQGKYGADVISRIDYCANPGGLDELQTAIIGAINEQIISFSRKAKMNVDQIVKITVAGNTTMLHLLLGVDPTSIALAPFIPQFTDRKDLEASDLGIRVNPDARLHILPSVSAYVGADITAGLASLQPSEEVKNYLFIDVGTNGEMALVMQDKILCCATAAGPALEGSNITCGMGAFPGAISEFISIDDYTTIGDELPVGLCGSGLIDIVAFMLRNNIIDSEGRLENEFEIYKNKNSGDRVYINQEDIRQVQLAKSAFFAGINILVQVSGIDFSSIDALFLAGGFGNFINISSAVEIGLLPKELENKTIPIGNTSGTGAHLSLKSISFDKNISDIIDRTQYVELSTHDDFVMEFALNMNFNV